jgi:hypothetical protein
VQTTACIHSPYIAADMEPHCRPTSSVKRQICATHIRSQKAWTRSMIDSHYHLPSSQLTFNGQSC